MSRQVNRDDPTVFVDADNTLWDTDKVFAEAQLNLLGHVESATFQKATTNDRLTFVRELDQLIAEKHHSRLRYPPRLLVRAIALALAGIAPEAAAKAVWANVSKNSTVPKVIHAEEIERQFFSDLKKLPELRNGVLKGLPTLAILGCRIVVFTEGDREKCDMILRHYDLRQYVDQIFEGPKHVDTFRRLARLRASGLPAIVVGDQLDRDIAPAEQAGFVTVYFPGGFRPKWQAGHAKVEPDYGIESFEQVAEVVRQVTLKNTSSHQRQVKSSFD